MTEHRVIWEVTWWTDAGRPRSDHGDEVVSASSPDAAMREVEVRLRSQIDGDRRPVHWRASIAGERWPRNVLTYSGTGALPDAMELRARYARSPGLAANLIQVREDVPAARPIELMVALAHAFYLQLEALAPVADWAAGALTDPELDAALGPAIDARRGAWEAPLWYRAAFDSGRSVAAEMRRAYDLEPSGLYLAKGLLDAFGIQLMAAKSIVEAVCHDRDAEADRMLADAIA